MKNAINSKIITAYVRAQQALKNNDGMEVIQFLAIGVVGVTIAGLLIGFGDTYVKGIIERVGGQISGLFPAAGG